MDTGQIIRSIESSVRRNNRSYSGGRHVIYDLGNGYIAKEFSEGQIDNARNEVFYSLKLKEIGKQTPVITRPGVLPADTGNETGYFVVMMDIGDLAKKVRCLKGADADRAIAAFMKEMHQIFTEGGIKPILQRSGDGFMFDTKRGMGYWFDLEHWEPIAPGEVESTEKRLKELVADDEFFYDYFC
ncbi:MAG: hypothetical protein NTU57_00220 [Candidatus Aenigmarchaeota archaeon]|nr:hypothetical protein [Candidatus Aenigmarchaeota archaeon]